MGSIRAEPLTRGSGRRSSMRGFWVAAAVAVLGLSAAAVWAALGALSTAGSTEDLARGDVPGTVTAELGDPGTVVVYYEGEPVPSLVELGLLVTGPDGQPVPAERYPFDLRYDAPSAQETVGTAVARFEARTSGSYRVATPYLPGTDAQLAVGEDIGRGFVQTLVGPAVLAGGSLLAAVLIAVVAAVRINSRYRQPPES